MTYRWMSAGLASLVVLAGAPAQAWVTVLGEGLAADCSRAAMRGEDGPAYQAICTQALDSQLMERHDRAATHVNRGVMLLRTGSYAPAGKDFDEAVRTKPDMAEAFLNRGAVAIGLRNYAQSLPDLNHALELGVSEPEKAYFNRAIAYEGMADLPSAYRDYRKALELKPDWVEPQRELARFTVTRKLGS